MTRPERTGRTRPWSLAPAGLLALSACVLADPAPTLPVVAEGPPILLSVVPEQGSLLTTWPTEFTVTVQVVDVTETLETEAFEDYSTANITNPLLPNGPGIWSPPTGDPPVRTLHLVNLPDPGGPGCHTVRIIVTNATAANQPGSPVLNWTYVRSGNLSDCTSYDAGPLANGAFPDANASGGG